MLLRGVPSQVGPALLSNHTPTPGPPPLQSADGSKTVLVEWGREGDGFDLQKQVHHAP